MYFLTSTSILSLALLSSKATAESCSTYTPSGFPYTRPIDRTQIISKGIICDSTTTPCLVDIGGYVTNTRTLNASASDPSPLYSLVSEAVGFGFNDTVTQFIGGNLDVAHPQTWPIPNGTAGYVGWTGNVRCTVGVLSGCEGDAEALEGVEVEACSPYENAGSLSGSIHEIATDREAAMAVVCNPANTTAAKEGNNTNSCSSEDEKTGDASRMQQASMVLLVCALGVVCFGFGGL